MKCQGRQRGVDRERVQHCHNISSVKVRQRSGVEIHGKGLMWIFNAVHDDNLKNLLMSWYYAGYYTGLYEGQQQGTQVSHAKPEN
jgi:hypothetical protein